MVIYYDLLAFKFIGKEDYTLRDERGRNIILKKNDIIILKEGIRSRYLDYKKHLFRRVSIPDIMNKSTAQKQAIEQNASTQQAVLSEEALQQEHSQTQQTMQQNNANVETLQSQQ